MLATVLFTDIVDSTKIVHELGDSGWRELVDRHDRLVRDRLTRFDGREVKHLGDGFLAVFDGPTRALRCAAQISSSARDLGLAVRAGLHAGECQARGADVAGVVVNTAARIGAIAGPDEILVSATIRELVAGSKIPFEDRGRRKLKGLPGHWQLYAAGYPSAVLRIALFGPLALELDGKPLAPPSSGPARQILAWLALHPGMHARAEVAARLWPAVTDASARASLRVALSNLRQALGEQAERYVAATRDRIGMVGGDAVEVDARDFLSHLEAGRLEQAVGLCTAPLLEGMTDEWILQERTLHEERLGDAYARLADAAAATDPAAAAEWSRRWVSVDPLSEAAARALMKHLDAAGDRGSALAAYERLRDRLRTELGVAPSHPTRELAETLCEEPAAARGSMAQISVPLPASLEQLSSAALVGRERERDLLWHEWQEAAAGRARFAVVSGDAGIGKSSLCAHTARRCHEQGATVLVGRATEDGRTSFEPWVDALGHLFGVLDAAALDMVLGAERDEVARLFPSLSESHLNNARPRVGDAEGGRHRLLHALATVLHRAARDRPMMLLLEDLHWADESSLLLLRQIARAHAQSPLLLLCTYRTHGGDQRTLQHALAEVGRTMQSADIVLRVLREEEVRDLIASLTGAKPAIDAVEVVFERAAGNPLFVTETVRHFTETGGAGIRGGEWSVKQAPEQLPLPRGIKELIRQRMRVLSMNARHALDIAAVAGIDFEFELIERVADPAADDMAAGIDEALEAGLLREQSGGGGLFEFTHALVRETIYDDVSAIRRGRLHLAVADALEAMQPPGARPVERLARHLLAAGTLGDIERAVRYACAAGDDSRARLAFERAAGYYREALTLLRRSGGGGDEAMAELLIDLGECEWAAGRFAEARAAFREAAAIAESRDAGELLARAVLGLGGNTAGFETGAVNQDLIRLLERALEVVPGGDSEARARLLARLAEALAFVPSQQERKLALVDEARAAARRLGDPATSAHVLHTTTFATWSPDGAAERAACIREILSHAEAAGETVVAAATRVWWLLTQLELGDHRSVAAAAAELDAASDGVRSSYERWLSSLTRGLWPVLHGDFAALEHEAVATVEAAPADQLNAQMTFGAQMFVCRREQGRLDEVLDAVRAFADAHETLPIWRCVSAWALGELGRIDESRDELQRVVMGDVIGGPRDQLWLAAMFCAAEATLATRDAELARLIFDAVLPYQERGIVVGPVPLPVAPAAYVLGMLAGVLGDDEAAVRFLARAIERCERLQASYWGAYAHAELARVLRREGDRATRVRSEQLLGDLSALVEQKGWVALQRRLAAIGREQR